MGNFNTDYKFSPKVREIIEARRGSKMGLTHAQAEFLIKDIFQDKYKGDHKFSEEDKKKILFYLVDFAPNRYDKEDLDNLAKFLLKAFDKKEVIEFVTNITNKSYFPGRVVYQIRVLNEQSTYFISLFPDYFKMYKGIIINTKFIGDVKKVYPEVVFSEETGEITDENVTSKINDFITTLKSTHKKKLKLSTLDDIYIIASDDEKVIENLGTFNLNVESIPEFYFKWK